jgi:flagellar biosynthesis protein FliR
MSIDYLLGWLLILLRSIGIVLQLPVVVGHPIPIPVRLGLCAGLATLLVGIVPTAPLSVELWPLLAAAGAEVLLGLALGFVVRFAFAGIEMAGRVISSEIGLSALPGMGVPEPGSEPLAALVSTFAVVLFFLFGGHHAVLTAFARSFQFAAVGRAALGPAAPSALVAGTAGVIELGLRIAAPFIAMNFLITLAFSFLGRAVPKMNVFILSLSARSLVGFALFAAAGSLVARYLYAEFGALPVHMLQLLAR